MAHALIDYGPEHNILWVSFQDDTGECWTWQNKDIRSQGNITYGRIDQNPAPVQFNGISGGAAKP